MSDNRLIGILEFGVTDQIRLIVDVSVSVTDAGDETGLVAELRRTPGSQDLDTDTERVRHCTAVALGGINAITVQHRLVARMELLARDDVAFATRIGNDPVAIVCDVFFDFNGAVCESGLDLLSGGGCASLDSAEFLAQLGGLEAFQKVGGFAVNEQGHTRTFYFRGI